jgi:formylglycine-generating enzyme required for sulfatase activity
LSTQSEPAASTLERATNARTIPGLNLDLVWVAPGKFLMGSPDNEPGHEENEAPQTQVTLTQPFWLGRTAVTQRQYEAVTGNNPSHFKGPELPVEQVGWDDAMAFCAQLTEREGAAGRLPAGYIYTLPTEAQREYACRAGTTGPFAGELDAMAWNNANSGGTTHPVGTKQPNAWGLFDMEGNVWEWCRDWYGDHLPGGEVTNPTGPPSGSGRVFRGGGWRDVPAGCRSAFRYDFAPVVCGSLLGFRVALVPSPQVMGPTFSTR